MANTGISGLGDASHKDHTGQENMQTQVHKHVPALETDSDQTVKRKREILIFRLVPLDQDTTIPAFKTSSLKIPHFVCYQTDKNTHTLFENSFNSTLFLNS